MISLKDKENAFGKLKKHIMDNGMKTVCMEKVNLHGQTAKNTQVKLLFTLKLFNNFLNK